MWLLFNRKAAGKDKFIILKLIMKKIKIETRI